ncbi:MAG: hypothetical protein ACI9R3_004734 [Verrucomicrobiales bacterium]|jgi:hypothetical protein
MWGVLARVSAAVVGFAVVFFLPRQEVIVAKTTGSANSSFTRDLSGQSIAGDAVSDFQEQVLGTHFAALEDADAATMPALLIAAEALPREQRDFAMQFVLARWLELDPEAALAFSRSDENRKAHYYIEQYLFQEWAGMDPEAAFAKWQELPIEWRKLVADGFLLGLLRHGPDVYLQFHARMPVDELNSTAGLYQAFAMLSSNDHETAIERALTLPENLRPNAFAGIAKTWIESDSGAALAWVNQLKAGNSRDRALSAILSSDWALHHPEKAGPLFGALSDQNYRLPRPIVLKMLESDPLAAAEWARRYLPLRDSSKLIRKDIVPALMKADPSRISALVTTLAESTNGLSEIRGVFGDLRSGHREAFNVLAEYPDDGIRRDALRGVISSWEFDAAVEAMGSLSAMDREALLPELAEASMPGVEPAEKRARLLDYMGTNDFGDSARNALMANVVSDMIDLDPTGAAELFGKFPEATTFEGRQIVHEVASGLAIKNPAEAVAWATTLEDSTQRGTAYSVIAEAYGDVDSAAGAQWLAGLQDNDGVKDAAIAAFSKSIRERDPEAGITWAGTIADPQLRSTTMGILVDRMAWNNPTSTRQLIKSVSMDEGDRQALLERIDHP